MVVVNRFLAAEIDLLFFAKLGYVIPEFHCIYTILGVMILGVSYFHSVTDSDGFVHSIDMVVIDYYLKCDYHIASGKLLSLFGIDCKSSLDNLPNFKYQYFVDMIWCDGFVFHLGKYVDYDKTDKSWQKLDMLRLEVNPNKHAASRFHDAVLEFLSEWCTDGFLVRFDYAVDLPVPIEDVLVINSRKEKGLYKGTRYFGRRHSHGYLKIYDKAKEIHEDIHLTRVEYTFDSRKEFAFDHIVVRGSPSDRTESPEKLSASLRLYLDMLIEIKALGGQIEPYIQRMNYRTWKKIEPYFYEGRRLECNDDLIHDLISYINDVYILDDNGRKVKEEEEFLEFSGALPWEG